MLNSKGKATSLLSCAFRSISITRFNIVWTHNCHFISDDAETALPLPHTGNINIELFGNF